MRSAAWNSRLERSFLKNKPAILSFLLLLFPCIIQAKDTVRLFQGHHETTIDALPYVRPPYADLFQFLQALGGSPLMVDGKIEVEINRRKLVMDPTTSTVGFNRKQLVFPVRRKQGIYYVRVDVLASVFTEFFGRRMIYEPTSRSLHMPLARDLVVTVRTRKIGDSYRVIMIYSDPVTMPSLKEDGSNLVVIIDEKNVQFEHDGFDPNEAVSAMHIFKDLPNGTTEVLFRISKETIAWKREPFQPENPRTVLKFIGNYAEPQADEMAQEGNEEGGIRRITIDPGHGGIDRGAVGPTGLREKDVTLDLALSLQKRLVDDYEIQLTRKDDSSLSLKTRTAKANSFRSDLLLSIHVNAIHLPAATGSETYYLSLDAEVPDHPHYETELELEAGTETQLQPPIQDDLSLILWDMAQNKFAEDSFRIAKHIQESLNVLSGIRNRGVKQASLKVLRGATMPAVLVEVAFITNRLEEKRLKTSSFREKIVNAITRAIHLYDEDVRNRGKGQTTNEEL